MFQSFEQFLAASSAKIPVAWFVINLILTAFFSLFLGRIYEKYGTSLSNRRLFGRNFLLITMTTMLIISIVKSSLALSLGLVGALSIIRFRAAIKEPEELAYLFFAISIGLGFGANQGAITTVAFIIITLIVILYNKFSGNTYENQNLYLTINSNNPHDVSIDNIVEILKKHCSAVTLKRLDETETVAEASFLVELIDFDQLKETKNALRKLDSTIKFSFLDNKGVY